LSSCITCSIAESFRFCPPPAAAPLPDEADAACDSNEKLFPDPDEEAVEDEARDEEGLSPAEDAIESDRAIFSPPSPRCKSVATAWTLQKVRING
jgi:hypothetical protein